MSDDRVLIFDTTLRDGEQCPGASMTVAEKLRVAQALDDLRVDVIEAGFPASSPGDFEAVEKIAATVKEATVCALSRAKFSDIEAAVAALSPARNRRIHTFISTSPLHMKHKLQMEPHAVLQAVTDSVSHARNLCGDVEWSCEDGTRSDFDFLRRCFEAAIKAGARTVNIADTVGYTLPDEFYELVARLRNTVPGMEKVRFSIHCHDDLGLATSNSLAAIRAGARQFECTVNGIGERAGNASLEEIVMAIYTRRDSLGVSTGVRTEGLTAISQLVSDITGFAVPPNKAVVGANAFAHESGIHQHGVLMNRGTYEIIDPETVGAGGSRLVMGKHSGRHALRARLDALGYVIGENKLQDIFTRFKEIADERKILDDEDIIALVEVSEGGVRSRPVLHNLRSEVSANGSARVRVEISCGNKVSGASAAAQSSFHAIANAFAELLPGGQKLGAISIQNANGVDVPIVKASVSLHWPDGHRSIGQGASPDASGAFARGYLAAYTASRPSDKN